MIDVNNEKRKSSDGDSYMMTIDTIKQNIDVVQCNTNFGDIDFVLVVAVFGGRRLPNLQNACWEPAWT